ncbi:DUF2029 domain-containing protein [bacterium]|nr:DUF2029 domain-containing protein [bacterium]
MAPQSRWSGLIVTIKTFFVTHKSALVLILLCLIALGLRLSTWDIKSGDMEGFLLKWYDHISVHGRFQSFSEDFYNYTPSYIYLMSFMTSFRFIPPILAIKLISIVFDFLAAFFVFKIVQLKYSEGSVPHIASAVFLFAPTVFFNSAVWGQCDIIYTTGILAVVYFCLAEKDLPAVIAFGIALAFKLQAVFIAPLLLILILKRRIRWWLFFLVPAVYLLSILPAWIAGRPFSELISIYFSQANVYPYLSLYAPNLYQWLGNEYYAAFVIMGMLLTAGLVVLGIFAFFERKIRLDRDAIVALATLSVLAVPFFLPKMHDRYFFPADVLAIVFAFYFPKHFYVPIVVGLTSFMTYISFLFDITPVKFTLLPFGLLAMIVVIIVQLGRLREVNETVIQEQ